MTTESKDGHSQGMFATPSDVLKIVSNIELSMLPRKTDRAIIDIQFNGGRPFTAQEEKESQIQVNANFLEGYRIAQNGNLQINSALLYKDRFFNARCLKGKATKRGEWGEKFTINIHKPLKRGRSGKKFFYLMQNRNAALTLHGVGPVWWSNQFEWMPRFISLDDLLIPTDSPLEMSEELSQFGVNSWITPWQLFKMTQQQDSDPGWDKEMAMDIIKSLTTSCNFTPNYYDEPEKMESLWKQRSTYLNSDAVPKVKITTFYHQDPETGKWWRKVIMREAQSVQVGDPDKFLYNGKQPYADSFDEIMHLQFGDGSVVAPFKYRSVRGLGVLLFSVVELMNRLRCQFMQHVFSNMVPLLRIQNPATQDRPRMLQMQPYGVVDQGVTFIPENERHQIDPRLVESAMSENRQLMSESSSSYVQDIDTGTSKEMTLGEAQIRLQSVNKLVSSMLMSAYEQECFLFEQIIKRFLDRTSNDPEVKLFQSRCKADGIPEEYMEANCWQVDITRAFGAGDQTLAQQEVTALMNIAPQLDPTAQRTVRRQFIAVMTRNPDLANALVPEEPAKVTAGSKAAEDVFGTLMLGVPVGLREGIEQTDYVQTMMAAMANVIQQIQARDDVGTPEEVVGLQTVAQDIEQHLAIIEQDPNEKEFTTAASKELGAMMNFVKAFQQRQEEAAQNAKPDPETAQKLADQQALTEQKLAAKQASDEQKMAQKNAQFEQKMEQDQAKFAQSMIQQQQKAMAELEDLRLKTITEITAARAKTGAEVEAIKDKADATPAPKAPKSPSATK